MGGSSPSIATATITAKILYAAATAKSYEILLRMRETGMWKRCEHGQVGDGGSIERKELAYSFFHSK